MRNIVTGTKLKTTMEAFQFRNTDTDIENNSRWSDFFMLKQQHYTLKEDEDVK